MLKKTITYTDYNGVTRTEDFYFNLSRAELAMMDLSKEGGLEENLMPLVNKMDIPKLAEFYEELIRKSYGEKSPDGKRFIKSKELSDAFMQSEAYSELFSEMFMNNSDPKAGATAAAAFLSGIMPKEIQKDAASLLNDAEKIMPVKFDNSGENK